MIHELERDKNADQLWMVIVVQTCKNEVVYVLGSLQWRRHIKQERQ